MNIIAIQLVLVGTKPGLIVMCKILMVASRRIFILCACVNSTFLGCDSLLLILIIWNNEIANKLFFL